MSSIAQLMSMGLEQFGGVNAGGGGGGSMVPIMEAVITMPEMLDQEFSDRSRINRLHAKVCKEALTKTLQLHHKKRIPQHFDAWKQEKYNYAPRSPVTDLKKLRRPGGGADLVKTGRTKREMTQRMQVRHGGSASTGQITSTGVLRWPPGFKTPDAGRVNRGQMIIEIQTFTEREQAEVAEDFMRFYREGIVEALRGRRVSRRVRALVASRLGVTI